MALVIRHEQLPIASEGWALAPGCGQRPDIGTNMVGELAVAYCWFWCRTWHPGAVRSAWPTCTFLNTSFSTGVSEVTRQAVGYNPSTMLTFVIKYR